MTASRRRVVYGEFGAKQFAGAMAMASSIRMFLRLFAMVVLRGDSIKLCLSFEDNEE